jgi:hypothetical protein
VKRPFADEVRQKDLLGYHDLVVGNDPDKRLLTFIHNNLPALIEGAWPKFERFHDLLFAYSTEQHKYKSFAARVRRRLRGEPEDLPPLEEESGEEDYLEE